MVSSAFRRWLPRFDQHRPEGRRSHRHGPAELRGGRDAALGLPTGRHRDHAGQLARQGRRTRFLHREFRSRALSSTRTFRAQAVARSKRASGLPRIASAATMRRCDRFRSRVDAVAQPDATPRVGRRSLVDHALYIGTTSRPKGVPRRHRAERAAAHRPCRAKPLSARRTDARRHAALSHHGRPLVDRDVADRRHVSSVCPATIRARRWR